MSKEYSQKADLIIAIQELLQKGKLAKQEDIRAELEKKGMVVNQTMISRVLHKLGAVKISEGNNPVYRLSSEFKSVSPDDSLKHLILNISHNESLIVIETTPGSAQLVARLLDQKKEMGILGTVAGDDTIFVAPKSTAKTTLVYQKIYHHFFS